MCTYMYMYTSSHFFHLRSWQHIRSDPLVLPLSLPCIACISRGVKVTLPCTDNCKDGDVRLDDGDSSNEGRVEMCLHQRWGSVSDEGWSAEDAQVVCNQLGFSAKGSLIHNPVMHVYNIVMWMVQHVCYVCMGTLLACSN